MSEENREIRYLRLIQEEKDAFERAKKSESARLATREAKAREWFAALARLLKEHFVSNAMPGDGGPLQPYPGDAILRIAGLADALAAGRIPQAIKDINASGGRPERWPGERRDIAIALDYIAHARARRISDRAFIVTVAEAFSVDRTTVRDWDTNRQEITEGLLVEPVSSFPAALKVAGARYHFNRTGERTEGVE